MNHHPHLEEQFLLPYRVVHHHRAPAAVRSVPAAVRDILKEVGALLEHHYVLCQHKAYLVADTPAAAILAARN